MLKENVYLCEVKRYVVILLTAVLAIFAASSLPAGQSDFTSGDILSSVYDLALSSEESAESPQLIPTSDSSCDSAESDHRGNKGQISETPQRIDESYYPVACMTNPTGSSFSSTEHSRVSSHSQFKKVNGAEADLKASHTSSLTSHIYTQLCQGRSLSEPGRVIVFRNLRL